MTEVTLGTGKKYIDVEQRGIIFLYLGKPPTMGTDLIALNH